MSYGHDIHMHCAIFSGNIRNPLESSAESAEKENDIENIGIDILFL